MSNRKRKHVYAPKPHLTIAEDATGYLFTTRNESSTKAAREAIRLLVSVTRDRPSSGHTAEDKDSQVVMNIVKIHRPVFLETKTTFLKMFWNTKCAEEALI